MKKTNILTGIIAISVFTFFFSCKKEIAQPKSEVNAANNNMPAAQASDVSAIIKKPIIIITMPDSTKAHP